MEGIVSEERVSEHGDDQLRGGEIDKKAVERSSQLPDFDEEAHRQEVGEESQDPRQGGPDPHHLVENRRGTHRVLAIHWISYN